MVNIAKNLKSILVEIEGLHDASFNFKDDAVGAVAEGWSDISGDSCSVNVIATHTDTGNSVKFLKVVDVDDESNEAYPGMTDSFTSRETGTIQVWFCTSDRSKTVSFWCKQGGATKFRWYVDANQIYAGGSSNVAVCTIENDRWYRIKMDWETTGDTFDVHVYEYDGTLTGEQTSQGMDDTPVGNIDNVQINTTTVETGYHNYFAAIDYSWDGNTITNYITGTFYFT